MNSQVAKRYACDRCREQKLRCSRNQQDGSTCDRCLRVRVFCVTSSGRLLGRPPLHGNDAARGHVDSNQPSYHPRRGRESWRRGLSIPTVPTTSNPLPSPTASGSDISGTSTIFPHGTTTLMQNIQPDESDYLHDAPSSASFLDASTSQNQFWTDSPNVAELDFGSLGDMAEPLANNPYNSTGNSDDSDSRQSESSSPNADSMAFFTSVIGSISRQLVELKNQSLESWDPHLIQGALFDEESLDFTCSSPMSFNSWENTIQITMRFVLVLQTMVPAQFSNTPPPFSPPTLSMTLTLLSTYIQLGELFNTILARISICLQEGSGKSEPLAPAAPASSRRPSPAQPARLQIMMMIQVFEHQLHSVERVLGLPSDCRLWSRKDAYAGILDQEKSSLLTQAVMGQAQETFRSLKRTIERIQNSLRGSSLSLQNSKR
jgi:hypothetical protein